MFALSSGHLLRCVLITVLLILGALVNPARAIDIQFHLEGPSENPAWDPDGSILLSIFEAAATYWEPIFIDSRSMTVDIEWENDFDSGILGLWTYDAVGNNNIEINSNAAFWADPTPLASEEFSLTQTLYADLTVTQQNDWYNGPVPGVLEVGWRGNALAGSGVGANHDLLSICMHELGHELGVRSDVGPVFPVYAHQVGGAVGVEAVKHASGGHLADVHPLMFAWFPVGGGERRLPAEIDSLAVAHAAGYATLSLPRTEFIGTSSDLSNPLNWIGGMTTSFLDATVRVGGSGLNPTASADMSFVNLTLTDGAWASTGSHLLDVSQTLTIDGAWALTPSRLSVNPGGTLEADDVRLVNSGELVMWGGLAAIDRFEIVGPVTGQFAMLPGATLRVDRLIGFGNNLQFLGNLQIGNSSGGILIVGANQSLNVLGSMAVGPSPGGSGAVEVISGGHVLSGALQIGSNSSSGNVLVRGYNSGAGLLSDWDVNGDLTIGSGGIGAGTLTVQLLATVDVSGGTTVRGSPDAPGRLVVESAGSFGVANRLDILPFGSVELNDSSTKLVADEIALSAGGLFNDAAGTILKVNRLTGFGDHPTFVGSVEFGHPGGLATYAVGTGQSLDVAEDLTVGDSAPAMLHISGGGAIESGRSFIGREPGAAGSSVTVTGSASRWEVLGPLYAGGNETSSGGAVALTISDNGQVNVGDLLKVMTGSYVTVGTASNSGTLEVDATLSIQPGSTVTVANGANLHANAIDLVSGGGLITTGPNSTVRTNGISNIGSDLTINGNLGVGWSGGSGIGSLTLVNGQNLAVTGVLYLGDNSDGTVSFVNGGTAQIGQARIGSGGGAGTLIVHRSNSVVSQNGNFYVGYWGSGSTGSMRIENGGSVVANNHSGFLASSPGTTGTALVDGLDSQWADLGALYVGGDATGPGGNGTLTVSRGGRVGVNGTLQVWNTGRVELLGSEINTASFLVQTGGVFDHHNGTLTVDGGLFSPGTTYNYAIDGPTGSDLPTLVLKNVASANIPNTLFVGGTYAGELRLESGAVLRSFNGRVGWATGTSDGRVNVNGGHWINTADLEVGVRNHGQMSISSGGVVRNTVGAIGAVAGSTGEVSVTSGGQWENSSLLYIGGKTAPGGSGSLVIASAEVSAADVTVWPLGAVTLDSGTIETNSLNLVGGALSGVGSLALNGPFANAGTVAPGLPIGLLTARGGDYVQSADGILDIDIGWRRLNDRLSISGGSATLDGALHVSLTGGYIPAYGNEFEILSAEGRVFGEFDPLLSLFQPIGGGLGWHVDYRENNVVLQVIHAAFLEADFDEDGDVDGDDLTLWQAGYATGTLHTEGDADGDGDVDGRDFLTWQRQFGSGVPLAVMPVAVPEPAATIWLLTLGIVCLGQSYQRVLER